MMEKYKIITIVSVLVILSIIGFSILNIYALDKLQLGGVDGYFRFYEMSVDDKIMMCNDFPMPVNFNSFKIIIFYENKLLGTFMGDGTSIMPNSFFDVRGKYISESYAQSQYLFMHFDHLFGGSDPTIRIDPRNMNVITEFHTSIMGIPYSVTEQYSSFDFWNMLNDKNNMSC